MRCAPALLIALMLAPAAAQSPPAPATLDSIAPAQRPLVRQRAMHFYRMPDGTFWDGWSYEEYRKQVEYTLKPFNKVDPGEGAPLQPFVEDKVIGTVWKIKPTRDARAWGLIGYLAGEDGEIPKGKFEAVDRQGWKDAPPLWWCAEQADYSWTFAYVDEAAPDLYTRKVHGGYLEVTRDWGDGRYEFKGYSLDRGRLEGVAHITEPRRFISKDRFKGTFFLWPAFADEVGGLTRQNWKLYAADDLRVTADQLAGALLSGKAQIVEWRFETVKDKILWRRTLRSIEPAPERIAATPPSEREKKPIVPEAGPDLVILKDGRYFRGRITRRDETAVVIRTIIGQMEADMTFTPDEVKEVQAPEKR